MKIKILALGLVILYFSSCATMMMGNLEQVSFNSDPEKAEIWVNGKKMGVTPLSLILVSKKNYTIYFKKDGYITKTFNITNHIGTGWVIVDVFFGSIPVIAVIVGAASGLIPVVVGAVAASGLIPVVVDATTGAWYDFDQNNINMILEKQQPKPLN